MTVLTAAGPVQVRLLGPVDLRINGSSAPVAGLRRLAVLAVLALQVGEVVSTNHLIDVVWSGRAPRTAANTLQRHVSYLRSLLGSKTAIGYQSPGYILNLDGEATDALAAARLIGVGMTAIDPTQRVQHLQTAIGLWRGQPLMDVVALPRLNEQAERLNHLLLQAKQSLAQARLALGQNVQAINELEPLTRKHPLHEQIHTQLILALYRVGRQHDALAVYERLRAALRNDLGIEPSSFVRDLHLAILRQDSSLIQTPRDHALLPHLQKVHDHGGIGVVSA